VSDSDFLRQTVKHVHLTRRLVVIALRVALAASAQPLANRARAEAGRRPAED
jgi:hypothetical protein